jgi:hypothetical protein
MFLTPEGPGSSFDFVITVWEFAKNAVVSPPRKGEV